MMSNEGLELETCVSLQRFTKPLISEMKHVVITGVSSGIGKVTAELLAEGGYHVLGSVRRQADAAPLQSTLGEKFTPLVFDVTDQQAVEAAAAQTANVVGGQGLAALINNAGIALWGPLMHQPLDEVRRHFDVNVLGLLGVTQAFLPLLGAVASQSRPPGRIVNVSSVGGKITFPFIGAYGATKHAVESLSDGLRRELHIYGIDVIVIEPGNVQTPIWDKAEQEDVTRYEGTEYFEIIRQFQQDFADKGRKGMPPEVVGRTIRKAIESKRPRTRYALPNRAISGWLVPRLLPDRWLDRMIVSMVGLKRSQR